MPASAKKIEWMGPGMKVTNLTDLNQWVKTSLSEGLAVVTSGMKTAAAGRLDWYRQSDRGCGEAQPQRVRTRMRCDI